MRVRRTTLLAIAALLLAAPGAHARSVLLTLPRGLAPWQVEGFTAMAGQQLLYEDVSDRHPRLWLAGPGHRDRVVARGVVGPLAASPQIAAVLRVIPHGVALLAGPPIGPLRRLFTCPTASAGAFPFAVDGTHVAYVDDGCGRRDPAPDAVVVRDGTNPAAPQQRFALPAGARADFVSLAGRYLAYRLTMPGGEQEIVLDDRAAGAEVLRTPPEATRTCDAAPHSGASVLAFCGLAVQADGKVAELLGEFTYYPGGAGREDMPEVVDTCGGKVDWLSPSDPVPHRVWDRACVSQPLRFAHDRLFGALRWPFRIGVVDVDGHELDLGDPTQVYGFDGDHVYAEHDTCVGDQIVAESVLGDDPPLPSTAGIACPKRFPRAVLHLGRHPRLMLTVTCRFGCLGPIVVGTRNYVDAASRDFTLDPGGRTTLTIPLSRTRRLVRNARGRMRVRVAINAFDAENFDPRRPATKQVGAIIYRWVTARVAGSRAMRRAASLR